ncbi:MAG: Ig-like domain-containing protein, partial [Candidatus Zixiibacteriota bacterium]
MPPPGGPEDKTAPVLLSSTPANGDTLVPAGNTITLKFSERIVRPSTGRPIYISPRPEAEPEVDWKSDEIVIHLADSFQTDQTYIVTVSPTVADLRNNRLDTAITVAFTTGTSIASGVVSGNIYSDPDKPQPGVVAALYELPGPGESIDYDSVYPEYMTTTNKEGYFALRYLPTKAYRLIAFEDKNRNDRFNPYTESFAVPDRPINLAGEERLDRLMMFMTSMDTARAAVIGAAYTSDHLVRLRLSSELDPSYLADHLSNMQLRPDSIPGPSISALGFQESQLEKTGTILASFGDVPEGKYTV